MLYNIMYMYVCVNFLSGWMCLWQCVNMWFVVTVMVMLDYLALKEIYQITLTTQRNAPLCILQDFLYIIRMYILPTAGV